MSKNGFQNLQSFSGISGIGGNHESLMNELQSKQQILYTIKINAPQDGQPLPLPTPKRQQATQKQQKSITHKTPYTHQTTGYEINRQLYSDEEIREAFKMIDINKDGVLTYEDISFFLKCMGEEHTGQQVEEMINIISTDGKVVVLDDFKKIGKGRIIPFAGIRFPDQNTNLKQTILTNLKDSQLMHLQPEELIIAEETNFVSYGKFETEKSKKNEEVEEQVQEQVEEDTGILKSRTRLEIERKRAEVAKLSMLNIERIIENLDSCEREYLDSRDLADLLTINEPNARNIFIDNAKRIPVRQAILDAILFSSKPTLQRLQLILINYNRQENLSFEEWLDILAYMVGSEQREAIRRRLANFLKHRKLQLDCFFDKYYILKLMSEERSSFNFMQ